MRRGKIDQRYGSTVVQPRWQILGEERYACERFVRRSSVIHAPVAEERLLVQGHVVPEEFAVIGGNDDRHVVERRPNRFDVCRETVVDVLGSGAESRHRCSR